MYVENNRPICLVVCFKKITPDVLSILRAHVTGTYRLRDATKNPGAAISAEKECNMNAQKQESNRQYDPDGHHGAERIGVDHEQEANKALIPCEKCKINEKVEIVRFILSQSKINGHTSQINEPWDLNVNLNCTDHMLLVLALGNQAVEAEIISGSYSVRVNATENVAYMARRTASLAFAHRARSGVPLLGVLHRRSRNGEKRRVWLKYQRSIRGGREQEEADNIKELLDRNILSDKKDVWIISGAPNNEYSTRWLRDCIETHKTMGQTQSEDGNKWVPKKHNIFIWRLMKNRLPTRRNLCNLGIDVPCSLCPLCDQKEEDANHLFVECSISTQLWTKLGLWWQISRPSFVTCEDPIFWSKYAIKNKKEGLWLQVTVIAVMVSIWKLRNGVIFDKKKVEIDREFRKIMACVQISAAQIWKMATGSVCRIIGNNPRGVIRNVIFCFGDHSDF
ncbi:hypothetical protein LXL04_024857 [Taraxacum kok-saghyz]